MPRNIQPRKLDLDDPHDYNVYRHTAHILTPEIYDGGFPIFVRILKEMPAYKVGTIMRINSQNPTWWCHKTHESVLRGAAKYVDVVPDWVGDMPNPVPELHSDRYTEDGQMVFIR